jgi:putative ABC transport system permease protein
MLRIVLRRMFNNLWMVTCLLIGSILATALVSCIPIYTDGILQRMLIKDLEQYQLDSGNFPGQYDVKASLGFQYKQPDRVSAQNFFNKRIVNRNIPEMGLPVINLSHEIKLGNLYVPVITSDNGQTKEDMMFAQLGAISGLDEHVTITNGRMYAKEPVEGIYEVIVSQQAMQTLNLLLDKVYTVTDSVKDYKPYYKVKVVGVFTVKSTNDVFWTKDFSIHNKEFLMDYKLFNKSFLSKENGLLTEAEWNCAYDYHSITLQSLPSITKTYEAQKKWYAKYRGTLSFTMPGIEILNKYEERAKQLRTMLWVLTVPVLLMLIFYIFMVSQLIIGNDENGIAVMKSRGASKIQIFLGYLFESSFIGFIAFILGPPLGLLICMMLGSSSGFLEFVQRAALPVSLNINVFGYSLAVVVFLIVTMLAPVIASSRTTIVKHKQDKSRAKKAPLWKKLFFDIILLLASGYGLYRYNQQQTVLESTGIKAADLQIDPLLFLTSTLFVLGAGLLFLRIYPYLIRFIYWLGRKVWPPVMYISLIQVGRSRGQEQFLMLFIILAISTGLFNANSARTINKNNEDKISYSVGADVRLMAHWEHYQPPMAGPTGSTGQSEQQRSDPIRYIEPDYNKFSNISGTEQATKVLLAEKGKIQTSTQSISEINIMGIIPDQFAKIAWFRPDLLPSHWYNYLNLMSDAPTAFLVSSNLKEKYKLVEGDSIYISWGDQSFLEGIIYAFIDYWPAYNPNPEIKGQDGPSLVVANLSYIQNKLAIQPYEVWIKKKPDAGDKQFNDDIIKRNLRIDNIKYREQELVRMKNDAFMQGMNGMLTLGFIAAMTISMLGFLIYWIISIKNRVLQFGILRAMGMSLTKVIGMLACEQILVSGAAILLGIIVGGLTCDTFIPLLQIVFNSADQIPPFKIMANAGDYIKIYAVIGTMLLMGFLILWRIIAKIKIDQAVKLGED